MTAVPVTRTYVAGEIVLDTHFNINIRDPLNFLLTPPLMRLRQTVAQTLTTGVFAAVTYTTEDLDSSGMHSNVTNTSRATAVYPGWYGGWGGPAFATNTTGRRIGIWSVNAALVNGTRSTTVPISGNSTCLLMRPSLVFLNVTDYLEQSVFQDSGGNLATSTISDEQSSFDLGWGSN